MTKFKTTNQAMLLNEFSKLRFIKSVKALFLMGVLGFLGIVSICQGGDGVGPQFLSAKETKEKPTPVDRPLPTPTPESGGNGTGPRV